jgi:hypothetical protein
MFLTSRDPFGQTGARQLEVRDKRKRCETKERGARHVEERDKKRCETKERGARQEEVRDNVRCETTRGARQEEVRDKKR